MKKFCITFFLLQLTITNILAADQLFILKDNNIHKPYFEIEINDDNIIYANSTTSNTGFPLQITLLNSENIKSYNLIWPKPEQKYINGVGVITFYKNLLNIPLVLDIIDPNKPVFIEAELQYAICNEQCVPVKQIIKQTLNVKDKSFYNEFQNYLWLIMLSLIGGFILNFMPCVLPVLSFKIFALLKHKSDNIKIASISTIAGIITSFWLLSLMLIIFKSSGKQFGLGINFQTPEFIIFLLLIITFFISSALGRFNISLPQWVHNASAINFKHKYLNHYFSGILAAILSTPCSAPFLGSAIFIAFSGDNLHIFLSYTFIAIGFSVPYILLMIYPKILNILPKSGTWMIIFHKILIIFLIGTVFWLLYVLNSQIGWRGTFGLFLLMILLKFIIENDNIRSLKPLKFIFALIIIAAGMILPIQANKEDFFHQEQINSTWHEFNINDINQQVKNGKIVFVDVTADWCLTCSYNRFMVLDRDRTINLFKKHNVFAMRGDLTSHHEIIYSYIVDNNSYGIPFYKIYGPKKPDGLVLPVIISYSDLIKAIKKVS